MQFISTSQFEVRLGFRKPSEQPHCLHRQLPFEAAS